MRAGTILMLPLLATALMAQGDRTTRRRSDDPQALKAAEAHLVELSGQVIEATVALRIGQSGGSGVLVSEDGLILTAAHVFPGPGRSARVYLHDGRRLPAVTLGKMHAQDFGMLRIKGKGPFPYAKLGDSSKLRRDEALLATGHPGGYDRNRPPVLRFGNYRSARNDLLRTSCVIEQGDSGGPLFNMQGEVVGIHSRISRGQASNFHVPINLYRDSWERLVASKVWPGYIGIRGEDGTLDDHKGCRILSVESDMPAKAAGIQAGDLVVKIEGETVTGIKSLQSVLRRHSVGDQVAVEVVREGGERRTLAVTLES